MSAGQSQRIADLRAQLNKARTYTRVWYEIACRVSSKERVDAEFQLVLAEGLEVTPDASPAPSPDRVVRQFPRLTTDMKVLMLSLALLSVGCMQFPTRPAASDRVCAVSGVLLNAAGDTLEVLYDSSDPHKPCAPHFSGGAGF